MINREKLYDLIYDKADKLLKQYNPCNIKVENDEERLSVVLFNGGIIMNAFNEWFKENYGEMPINKDSKPPLQFTKLTTADLAIHQQAYTTLLRQDTSLSINERRKELNEAMKLFRKEFIR